MCVIKNRRSKTYSIGSFTNGQLFFNTCYLFKPIWLLGKLEADQIFCVYELDVNLYRNFESLQLLVRFCKPH